MGDRIEASISVALSEDISENIQKSLMNNTRSSYNNKNKSNNTLAPTTEKLLENCLDVDGGENDPKWDIVRSILQLIKQTKSATDVDTDLVTGIGTFGNIPLHLICFKDPPIDIIKSMLVLSPKSSMIPDKEGDLPLHFACLSNASSEVIQLLVDAYPHGRNIQGELGNTPLHCALLQEHVPNVETIQYLLTEEVIHIKDHRGWIPLELFAKRIEEQPSSSSHNKYHATNVTSTDRITTLLIESYPIERHQSLLESISSLPTQLQQQIIQKNTHFHKCMDRSCITRLATFCTFLMCYVNLFVILSFTSVVISLPSSSNTSSNKEVERTDLKWETFGLRIGILTWTLSILLQCTAALYQKRMYKSFLLHIPTWIDVASVFFLFHSMYIFQDSLFQQTKLNIFWLMNSDTSENEIGFVLIVTTALIWIRLFTFLCLCNDSLSLFLSRTLHVVSTLIPFFVATATLVCAFALMYYIDDAYNSDTSCITNEEGEPSFCTMQQSLVRVFSMVINREIDTPELLSAGTASSTTLWLTICFSLTVLLILLNFLIATVVESYRSYHSSTQATNTYYWKCRHKQIQDVAFIQKIVFMPITLYQQFLNRSNDIQDTNTDNGVDYSYYGNDAILWNNCWNVLQNETTYLFPTRESNWYCGSFMSSSIVQCFMKIIVLLYILTWLILGLFTFGFVLPPQVRNWILSSDEALSSNTNNNTNYYPNQNSNMDEKVCYNLNKMEQQQQELMFKYDKIIMLLYDMNANTNSSTAAAVTDTSRNGRSLTPVPSIEVCFSENTSVI